MQSAVLQKRFEYHLSPITLRLVFTLQGSRKVSRVFANTLRLLLQAINRLLLLLLKQLHCTFEGLLQFGFVHLVLRLTLVHSPLKVCKLLLNGLQKIVHLCAVSLLQFLLFGCQFPRGCALHILFQAIQLLFPSLVAFLTHLFGVLAFPFKVLVSPFQVVVSLVKHALGILAFCFQLLFQFVNLPFVPRLRILKEHENNSYGNDDDKCKNYFHVDLFEELRSIF